MHSNVHPGRGGEAPPPSESIDLADVLEDPHCRYLLEYLRRHEGPVSVSTLARHVVARITGTRPTDVDDDVVRRVQTWLHHGQLPVLNEYDVVAFDVETGDVSLGSERPDCGTVGQRRRPRASDE